MSPVVIVLIVIAAILTGTIIILAVLGRKAQKRQAEQDEKIAETAQNFTMLIIDKKKMKMTEAGLPENIIANTPWYSKRAKVPVVKAKVGPKVMTFICDPTIFDMIPVKQEVKAKVSGLYISAVTGVHGKKITPPSKKKKGIRAWAQRKMREQEEENRQNAKSRKKK
ncbi:MAG: hypothetical protein DUD27_00210 [Lachnospiraceae bacterium]|uniref:Uncharacterized protein n=1 Tax=Candidatus Weimeria bifida TaxID=2599074 RepID=A0A6N7J176_9FIRM|nr:hypothetical protein [Candidatus Weimeria bifida]RRF97333.1 MAG: hypothetical protein DUD27_00210 [Lachnospiraceae bacterium]